MARPNDDSSFIESDSKISSGQESFAQRSLELSQGQCWSTRDDRKPNRYCIFDDTPRIGAFLSLSCPTTRDDLSQCGCTIGIGDSEDAPNTETCWKCGFCRDGSLAYDCRNVAEGTCIGRYVYSSLASMLLQDELSRANLKFLSVAGIAWTTALVVTWSHRTCCFIAVVLDEDCLLLSSFFPWLLRAFSENNAKLILNCEHNAQRPTINVFVQASCRHLSGAYSYKVGFL